jgi:LAO/AO transport system kinase
LRKRAQDPQGYPIAMPVSALEDEGLHTAWERMQTLVQWRRDAGFWDSTRAAQARYWFMEDVKQRLLARLEQPAARAELATLADQVAAGEVDPSVAAQSFVKALNG